MNAEIIGAICTGGALIVGALTTPLVNLVKDLATKKKDESEVSEDKQYVTHCELEVKHREIMEDVGRKFASNDTVMAMQGEFKEIKGKLNDIYDFLIKNK